MRVAGSSGSGWGGEKMNGVRGYARRSAGVPRRARLNMENSGLPRCSPA
ncbi:hypothetical protein CLOSTASPAR_01030 [[Clostridium] asparagiforme DSM 15981]|uniref:Uncharacterized protein n=1 Tax=[Clostridium] asparagiforme DSM 15981 TaxID=518636 RepID=C0CVM7_9FIRM|nr:hypothetical protein CLOSTASPAR_01030 [[Clostridium] asparagiforme DSM 15981]